MKKELNQAKKDLAEVQRQLAELQSKFEEEPIRNASYLCEILQYKSKSRN